MIFPIFLAACMATEYNIGAEIVPVRIGETTVNLVIHEADKSGLTYLVLHDNENTAVEAVLDVIGRNGGRLIEVRHTDERNVTFTLNGEHYVFDPNRIFTDAGARTTLAALGKSSSEALTAVRAFADTILHHLSARQEGIIVTVHNNTAGEYSTLSYTDDTDFTGDALFVHLANQEDPDNFFFVTEQGHYDAMRSAGFNVVMQDNANVKDDGSLSVYAGSLGIPYVNVEAEHGQFEAQVHMLEFLNELLASER